MGHCTKHSTPFKFSRKLEGQFSFEVSHFQIPNTKQEGETSNVEEFKAGATGGSFIKDSVQKVKAQCTKKSLGEQPGYHRGFRFYS